MRSDISYISLKSQIHCQTTLGSFFASFSAFQSAPLLKFAISSDINKFWNYFHYFIFLVSSSLRRFFVLNSQQDSQWTEVPQDSHRNSAISTAKEDPAHEGVQRNLDDEKIQRLKYFSLPDFQLPSKAAMFSLNTAVTVWSPCVTST